MFGRSISLILAVGIFAGLMVPDGEKTRASEDAAKQQLAAQQKAKSSPHSATREPPRRRADVTIKRRYDGHFYTTAMVNGRSVEFLVDTGATGIALTRDDAEAVGLFWNQTELETVGRSASGPVTGKMVRLDQVELGGKEVRDIDAAIIPEGLAVSLLGQSFLSRFEEVKIVGDEMTLN